MFPIEAQTFLPENINVCLQNIENRSLSLEKSLNEAYETVYLMNTKLGVYNTCVSMAVYKWLLCCRTSLPADEVLILITYSLNLDPKLKGITLSSLNTKLVLQVCMIFQIEILYNYEY